MFEKIRSRTDFPTTPSLDPETKSNRVKGGKYCKFHKNHGHLTDKCREFFAYVERLICEGEIDNFVKGHRGHDNYKSDQKGKHPRPPSPDSDDSKNRQ